MNDLLEHYLVEARELVEAATADLLVLEGAPSDAEVVNRVFRAFHTLKGSVGLFDLPAMLRVLHGAEDLLAGARAGSVPVDAKLIDLALEVLDQVSQWNDAVERDGALPSSAESDAHRLTARFPGMLDVKAAAHARVEATAVVTDWLGPFLETAGSGIGKSGGPLRALRYVPRPDCFFNGDDPLGVVRKLDGIVALRITPFEPWGASDAFDAFACNLAIECLTSATRLEIEAHFRLVSDQVDIVDVPATGTAVPAVPDPPRLAPPEASRFAPFIRNLIEEQCRLLATPADEQCQAGNAAAAVKAIRNVLWSVGAEAEMRAVEDAAAAGTTRLLDAVAFILDPPAMTGISGNGAPPAVEAAGPPATAPRTIRVDLGRIDDLLGLVGEFVTARNVLAHLAASAEAGGDAATLARSLRTGEAQLGRLVTDLHRKVVGIRLMPFDQAFRRIGRPLREIAQRIGKDIDLVAEGGDVEADRTVVDGLFEPLLHVVRNAVDHGIEEGPARRRAGKPERGKVTIRARSEGETVVVAVSDDGGGIDPALIRRRTRERGLAEPAALDAMSDAQVVDLIFAAGFSTATAVTDVSGRGVGMDAVRSAAGRLGGRVEVTSEVGTGTTVSLILPRTVALTQVMVVGAGGDLYGVPLDAVAEAVQVPRDRIVDLGYGEAVVLRERTVPVVRLARLLDVGLAATPSDADARLLVIRSGDGTVAIEVDAFGDRIDAVVKPLGAFVPAAHGITGTTLLGSGRVLLVLDPASLVSGESAS